MTLTIDKLAKQANVSIETIRHYQRKGILITPEKPLNGYRQYPTEAISKIHFIKHAQQAGFTLKEISALLDNAHCQGLQKLAEQKLQKIDQQIEHLTAFRNVLESLLEGCQQDQSLQHCSLIDALTE